MNSRTLWHVRLLASLPLAILCLGAQIISAQATRVASQPATATSPAAKGKTIPEGLPLEARLIVKNGTYGLDPGQSGEAFAKELKEKAKDPSGRIRPPAPPVVDMTFELTNKSKSTITIPVGSDDARLELKLEGPGAVTVPFQQMHTLEFRVGRPLDIEPGKSTEFTISRLHFGERGDTFAAYWTQPGTYTLTASYVTPVEGVDLKGARQATIIAAPVQVQVTAPEKAPLGNAAGPADR